MLLKVFTQVIVGIGKFILFLSIAIIVGNNPKFFGGVAQVIVDTMRWACVQLDANWVSFYITGPLALIITIFLFYGVAVFLLEILVNRLTRKIR